MAAGLNTVFNRLGKLGVGLAIVGGVVILLYIMVRFNGASASGSFAPGGYALGKSSFVPSTKKNADYKKKTVFFVSLFHCYLTIFCVS